MELAVIPISHIIAGERFRVDYGDIDALAASLKKEGIIQPLAVRRVDIDKFDLCAGGRRLMACERAGITEIPVRIYPPTMTDLELRAVELMENVCRKDLAWDEAARLRKEIHMIHVAIHGEKTSTSIDAIGWSQADTAKLLGRSPGGVSDDIAMASALEIFPQLKEAKTKNDASKLLKKLQEEMVLSEISKRIQAKSAGTPLEILHKGLIDRYIIADFFEGVKKIPDKSIDIIEIDPPYGIDLNAIKKVENSTKVGTKDYNEVPVDQYIPFLNNLFKECHRVMSENSWLICWFAYEPWFEFVYQGLMRVGFQGSRLPGMWFKEGSSGQTNHPDKYMGSVVEPFFYVRKGSPVLARQGRPNVFSYKTVNAQSKIHPTERPVEMIQDVLQTFAWEGARLLVPFLGSGNTLLAAANLGITGLGFDLAQEYKDAYTLRVLEGRPQAYRSYKEVV
jgi:site-specific DNA-methyltransferase (adenine-specific)